MISEKLKASQSELINTLGLTLEQELRWYLNTCNTTEGAEARDHALLTSKIISSLREMDAFAIGMGKSSMDQVYKWWDKRGKIISSYGPGKLQSIHDSWIKLVEIFMDQSGSALAEKKQARYTLLEEANKTLDLITHIDDIIDRSVKRLVAQSAKKVIH